MNPSYQILSNEKHSKAKQPTGNTINKKESVKEIRNRLKGSLGMLTSWQQDLLLQVELS